MSSPSSDLLPWSVRHHWVSSPLQLLKEFSVLAFQEELPQAFSSGCQSQGRGSHFLAAKGERLLRQHLICWLLFCSPLKIIDLSMWIRNEGWSCKGACYSSLIEMVWSKASLFTLSEDPSLCFPQGQENVTLCLRTEPRSPGGVSALPACPAANQPTQSTDVVIFGHSYTVKGGSNSSLKFFLMTTFIYLVGFFSFHYLVLLSIQQILPKSLEKYFTIERSKFKTTIYKLCSLAITG